MKKIWHMCFYITLSGTNGNNNFVMILERMFSFVFNNKSWTCISIFLHIITRKNCSVSNPQRTVGRRENCARKIPTRGLELCQCKKYFKKVISMMQGVVVRKATHSVSSKERKKKIHLCNKAHPQVTVGSKKENSRSISRK